MVALTKAGLTPQPQYPTGGRPSGSSDRNHAINDSLLGLLGTPPPIQQTRETSEVACWTSKPIGAVCVESLEKLQKGKFCQLAAHSELSILSAGFDDRTVTVRCHGELYVVFKADIHVLL